MKEGKGRPPDSESQQEGHGEGVLSSSLELHSPRGDVEHGRVEPLASEGRAFSVPPLLQHLMDFLQQKTQRLSPITRPARLSRTPSSRGPAWGDCRHMTQAPRLDPTSILSPAKLRPPSWQGCCPFSPRISAQTPTAQGGGWWHRGLYTQIIQGDLGHDSEGDLRRSRCGAASPRARVDAEIDYQVIE